MRRNPHVHHIPTDGRTRRLWIYAGVFAFVVVDILLVVWAVSFRSTPPLVAAPASTSSATLTQTPSPSPTPEPTESTVSSITTSLPATRLITGLNETVAWRATTGPCPETPASPEYTLDGGLTWTTTDATGPTEITALQSITVEDDGIASMIGLSGESCSPEFIKTFIAGDNYRAYPEELAESWYLDPADRAVVHSPSGDSPAPCDVVVALAAQSSDAAAVLCEQNDLYVTTDSAETWSSATIVNGAVSVTATSSGYLTAAVGNAECAGVQVLPLSLELAVESGSCFTTDVEPTAVAGNLAMSSLDDAVWLWAGDELALSVDGGENWALVA